MFKRNIIRHWKDESGSALVEFSMLIGFLLFMTFGILEGGYIFYQVNGAQKATQTAARYAATRPPVVKNMDECVSTGGTGGTNAGIDCSVFAGNFDSVTCYYPDGDTADCDLANFTPVRNKMKDVFPFIKDENIFITYEGTGLGYVGRGRPVPAITVELRNIQYNYIVIGQLLQMRGASIGTAFKINNVQTTVIGEDIGEGA